MTAEYDFFRFGFYGPFKNISLISSRSFIEGGRKPENPEKNHLTIRKQNLAFPHMTRARLEPQPKSQLSYPLGYGGPTEYDQIRNIHKLEMTNVRHHM